jgi:putative acetyltransferase
MSTSSISIRPFSTEDVQDYHALITHPLIAEATDFHPALELQDFVEWGKNNDSTQHRLAAITDDRLIGIALLNHNPRPRMSHSGKLQVLVHPDFWRCGVGSKLMAAALDLADNWLNLYRIQAESPADNQAGLTFLAAFGFTVEGRRRDAIAGRGGFQDDVLLARIRPWPGPTSSPPPTPPPRRTPPQEIIIRPPQPEDKADILELYQQPEVCRTILQLPSQGKGVIEARYGPRPAGLFRFHALADGKAVGSAAIFRPQNPRRQHLAGLGMMVHRDYWGLGIGSRLMEAILDLADNWLCLHRVYLEVNTDNPRAVALYEKFGFVIEGRHRLHAFGDGRMADSFFMGRIRPGA